MNVAAFIFGLAGVAINIFPFAVLSNNNNPLGGLAFAGVFFGWLGRQGGLAFFLYGIFSIIFLVYQIMAIFKSYHALKRNRNKNVPGFFKFTAFLCFVEAALMFYVYSLYTDAVRSSGFYGLAGGGIAPYVPVLLQVLCYGLASHFARADEEEDGNRNNSNSASWQTTPSSNSSTQSSPVQEKIKTFEPVLGVETEALIKRAFIFMSDNDFDEAERYFEQALRQNPENSQAYLGKLMTELKVHNVDELSKVSKPLKDEKLFQRALSFANDEERKTLESYVEAQNNAAEAEKQAEIERKYIRALEIKEKISSSTDAQNVIEIFTSIAPYKDSEILIQELEQEKAELEILAKKYADAWVAKRNLERDSKPDIEKFNRVAEMFEEISSYKDSKSLAEEIRRSGIERVEEAKRDKRNQKLLMIFIIVAIIGAGAFYAYKKISERNAAEQAEQARIEAEKQEEKSRIEALKLELQGQK